MVLFKIGVKKISLQPASGLRIRILTSTNQDVTTKMFGTPDVFTDSYGLVRRNFEASPLPVGDYKIQLSGIGYETAYLNKSNNPILGKFDGAGEFDWFIFPATASNYTVIQPAKYVSPLAPIVFEVHNQDGHIDEILQATITLADGRKSVVESQPDFNGVTQFDVRNRVRLHPKPVYVSDGQFSALDMAFSQRFTVELATIIDGNAPVAIKDNAGNDLIFTLFSANIFPKDSENDLSEYVTTPAKWITPFGSFVNAFHGYYADVIVWLPEPPTELNTLVIKYYNASGTQVGAVENYALAASDFVQRVRVPDAPNELVETATLQVQDKGKAKTEVLTIYYRG